MQKRVGGIIKAVCAEKYGLWKHGAAFNQH